MLAAFRRISRSSTNSRTFSRRAAFSASSGVGGPVGASARVRRAGSRRPLGPVPQRLRVDPQISGDRPDRRLWPRTVQSDRVRLALRRIVQASVLRSSRSTSRVFKIRGQRPSSTEPWTTPLAVAIRDWLSYEPRGVVGVVTAGATLTLGLNNSARKAELNAATLVKQLVDGCGGGLADSPLLAWCSIPGPHHPGVGL